jgi:hypothetical protein
MLTDREFAELRLSVKRTWVPKLLLVLSFILLLGSVLRFYMISVLCERTGISWQQVWRVQRYGPDMNTIYVGAELKAQEFMYIGLFGLALSIILAAAAVSSIRQRRKDLLLIDLLDKQSQEKT